MKLKDICESREETMPVEINYQYEFENEHHEIDIIPVTFEVDVTITPDQYDTGDSPTGYDVVIRRAFFDNSKKPFNWKSLPKKEIAWIEDKAVTKATR
jgi:hypothetical protein